MLNISARRVFFFEADDLNTLLHHFCTGVATVKINCRFRTWSTLLSVMSELSATARAVCWLAAILQRKAKTCFEGRMAARPDTFLSGILPVGMAARVNSSQVCLVASRHSKVTLELVRKIKRYRAPKVVADSI